MPSEELRNLVQNLNKNAEFKGAIRYNQEEFNQELDKLRAQGFSGALCVSFRDGETLNSQWVIFCDGKLEGAILERDVSAPVPQVELLEEVLLVGTYAEIYQFSDALKAEVESALRPSAPGTVAPSEEPPAEAAPVVHEAREPAEAAPVVQEAAEPEETAPGRRKVKEIKVGGEELHLSVDEAKEREKVKDFIGIVRMCLSWLVGSKMGEKIILSQMRKQAITEDNATVEDMETFLKGVHKIVAFQVGGKKAGALIKDIKAMYEESD
jgi:hypothetical protein